MRVFRNHLWLTMFTVYSLHIFQIRFWYHNENKIKAFRNLYRTLTKIDQFNDHEINQTSLLNAAQKLGIQADSDDFEELLQECVKYDDLENTFLCVNIRIQDPVEANQFSSDYGTNDSTFRTGA